MQGEKEGERETNKQEIKEIYEMTMVSSSLSTSCSLALPALLADIVAKENFSLASKIIYILNVLL